MNYPIICLIFVIGSTVVGTNGYSIAETNVGIPIAYNRNTNQECTKKGFQCAEDCSTLMMCSAFGNVPLTTTKCSAPNRYCVDGACTSVLGPNCNPSSGSAGTTFKCSDVGIFPDPFDCTQYHLCEPNGDSIFHQCRTGFVFNSQIKMCQIGKTPCTKIGCSKAAEANTFISYASNPAYYAFCSYDVAKKEFETFMFKCPYEDFEVFDMKTKECKFKCKAKGNFQNPANCAEYYYCSGVNAMPMLAECPDNWIFDGTRCNKDKDKCVYKPTTTTTTTPAPQLGEVMMPDDEAKELISGNESDIIDKICIADSNLCNSGSPDPNTLVFEVTGYRTLIHDTITKYIIGLTVKNADGTTFAAVHVKVIKDDNGTDTRTVEIPSVDLDEITDFD